MFCIVKHQDQTWVFDIDNRLSFPVPFAQYAKEAIRHDFPDVRRYITFLQLYYSMDFNYFI